MTKRSTALKNKFNISWLYLGISLLISAVIVSRSEWGFYEFVTLTLGFHFAFLLIARLGKTLPIRELAGFIYTFQILLGALFTYKFYPNLPVGAMVVREGTYYAYAVPCVLLFCLGLYFPKFKYTNYAVADALKSATINKPEWSRLGIHLMGISYVGQLMADFFPSEGLNFIYSLLFLFRFVALYYLWVARNKYRYFFLLLIFLPFAINGFQSGLFIELFIWTFLTLAMMQLIRPLKFRTNLLLFVAGLFLLVVLQSVKVDFRLATWRESRKDMTIAERVSTFADMLTSFEFGNSKTRDVANARFVVRINEGFILSHILRNLPERHPFADGEYFKNELIGIFVPRFLVPDKAVVGSHEKFERFAGWRLDAKVAMAVSILGDGYGNFGYWGGILFCFLNGLLLNWLLHYSVKLAKKYQLSLILWMPIIFTYSVRCGDEFYIITNHIVKSSIFVLFIFFVLKRTGRLSRLSLLPKPALKTPKATEACAV